MGLERVIDPLSKAWRNSEHAQEFERNILHHGDCIEFLTDPRVKDLTSNHQARLDNLGYQDLVSSVLIPAAREAFATGALVNCTGSFIGKVGGLLERWRRHDPPHRIVAGLGYLLAGARAAQDGDENSISSAMAYAIDVGDLAYQTAITIQSSTNSPDHLPTLEQAGRYARAMRIRVEHARINNQSEVLADASRELLFFCKKRLEGLDFPTILSNPEFVPIRNDIAAATISAADPIDLQTPYTLNSYTLIAGLSEDGEIGEIAIQELQRRLSGVDNILTYKAIMENISYLPITAQTAQIWNRLLNRVLANVKDKKSIQKPVEGIANRIRTHLEVPELSLDQLNALRPVMDGLSNVLLAHLPVAKAQSPDAPTPNQVISKEAASELFRVLFATFERLPEDGDVNAVRSSIFILAVKLTKWINETD